MVLPRRLNAHCAPEVLDAQNQGASRGLALLGNQCVCGGGRGFLKLRREKGKGLWTLNSPCLFAAPLRYQAPRERSGAASSREQDGDQVDMMKDLGGSAEGL